MFNISQQDSKRIKNAKLLSVYSCTDNKINYIERGLTIFGNKSAEIELKTDLGEFIENEIKRQLKDIYNKNTNFFSFNSKLFRSKHGCDQKGMDLLHKSLLKRQVEYLITVWPAGDSNNQFLAPPYGIYYYKGESHLYQSIGIGFYDLKAQKHLGHFLIRYETLNGHDKTRMTYLGGELNLQKNSQSYDLTVNSIEQKLKILLKDALTAGLKDSL